jgi:hypothetical protein
MKLIFLDFDGVVNTRLYDSKKDKIGYFHPEDEAVNNKNAIGFLNLLVKETGAKVVVSSTWRRGETVETLSEWLCNSGFEGEVIGKTPRMDSYCRGAEIEEYLLRLNDVESYVILDDDSDMLKHQMDNFVKCSHEYGFLFHEYFKARMILDGSYGDIKRKVVSVK